jgi:hypothetical protein
MIVAPWFRHFSRLRFHEIFIKQSPCSAEHGCCNDIFHRGNHGKHCTKVLLGVTARAVLGFGVILVIAYLFGGI